jgi:biopolymer transport protein ExbD
MASNKLRNSQLNAEGDASVDMSPMIDLVFLLLIFFLVNATMIIVQQDPKVKPPVASNAKEAESGKGRIVVNIYENGDFFNAGGEADGLKFDTDEDLFDYIKEAKEDVDLEGLEPKLHLRGDKRAVFKHARKVIRIAAKAGVDQVIFATYGFEPNE